MTNIIKRYRIALQFHIINDFSWREKIAYFADYFHVSANDLFFNINIYICSVHMYSIELNVVFIILPFFSIDGKIVY